MSGVMMREMCADSRMRVGDAMGLRYPEDGDVDGDFGFLAGTEVTPLKRGIPTTDKHNHGARQSGLEALNRMREWYDILLDACVEMFPERQPTARDPDGLIDQTRDWSRSAAVWLRCLRDAFLVMLPDRLPTAADFVGLMDQAWSGSRSAAARLRRLRDAARGRAISWHSVVEQRLSDWSEFVVTQQELGLVLAAELWAEWRRHFSLSWNSVLRPFLLQRAAAMGEALRSRRTAWSQYWPHLVNALRTYPRLWWPWLTARVLRVGSFVRSRWRTLQWRSLYDYIWRERPSHRIRRFGCSLRSFSLSRREAVIRCCQDFCRCDRDWRLAEDILFLWEEPRVKSLVVALLFAFAVLAEVVAASYLPVLCASATTVEVGVEEVMASATLSHSVLTSLKGAAAVM